MELFEKKPFAIGLAAAVILLTLLAVSRTGLGLSVAVTAILLAAFLVIELLMSKALFWQRKLLAGGVASAVAIVLFLGIGIALPQAGQGSSAGGAPGALSPAGPGNTAEPAADQSFELGSVYYESGNYEKAIIELRKVPESSPSYVEAQRLLERVAPLYRAEITETARTFMEEDNYTRAISTLNGGLSLLPNDPELTRLASSYEKDYKEQLKGGAISKCAELIANGDLASAILSLRDSIQQIGDDAELSSLLSSYEADYRGQVVGEADRLFHAGDPAGAKALVSQGLNVLPSDSALMECSERYTPVWLKDMDYFTRTGTWDFQVENDDKDNTGQLYQNSIRSYGGSRTYKLNGQYSCISGTFYWRHEFRGSKGEHKLVIWGDGEKNTLLR